MSKRETFLFAIFCFIAGIATVKFNSGYFSAAVGTYTGLILNLAFTRNDLHFLSTKRPGNV